MTDCRRSDEAMFATMLRVTFVKSVRIRGLIVRTSSLGMGSRTCATREAVCRPCTYYWNAVPVPHGLPPGSRAAAPGSREGLSTQR